LIEVSVTGTCSKLIMLCVFLLDSSPITIEREGGLGIEKDADRCLSEEEAVVPVILQLSESISMRPTETGALQPTTSRGLSITIWVMQ
jgi:hypothetical protein